MTDTVVAARDPIRVHGFGELAGALKEASELEVPVRTRPARASRRTAKKEKASKPEVAAVLPEAGAATAEVAPTPTNNKGLLDGTFVAFHQGKKQGGGHGIVVLNSGMEYRVSERVLSHAIGDGEELNPGDPVRVRIGVTFLEFGS